MLQPLVEKFDLLPVARLSEVKIGDGGLDGVGPAPGKGERALELSAAFVEVDAAGLSAAATEPVPAAAAARIAARSRNSRRENTSIGSTSE